MTPLSYASLITPLTIHALWCSEKAKAFFEEARLVKFSAQVQDYQQQHVALQWRDALQKRFQGVPRGGQLRGLGRAAGLLTILASVLNPEPS